MRDGAFLQVWCEGADARGYVCAHGGVPGLRHGEVVCAREQEGRARVERARVQDGVDGEGEEVEEVRVQGVWGAEGGEFGGHFSLRGGGWWLWEGRPSRLGLRSDEGEMR